MKLIEFKNHYTGHIKNYPLYFGVSVELFSPGYFLLISIEYGPGWFNLVLGRYDEGVEEV